MTIDGINESSAPQNTDLLDRITLIETMMQEARRGTEYWGWMFVLWGVAYSIAIGLAYSPHPPAFAAPIIMIVALLLGIIVASKRRGTATTPISRSISAIWSSSAAAIFIFCFAASYTGHAEPHTYVAAIDLFIGLANCASSIILRWRVQFAVAVLWCASAIATCFVASEHILPILLMDTFVGLLGFGLYLMYCERRDRQQRAVQHG